MVLTDTPWQPLKYQRKLRGWSQQDLVDEDERVLGLTARTVGRWESGQNKPSPYYAKRLCVLFGMTAEELGIL